MVEPGRVGLLAQVPRPLIFSRTHQTMDESVTKTIPQQLRAEAAETNSRRRFDLLVDAAAEIERLQSLIGPPKDEFDRVNDAITETYVLQHRAKRHPDNREWARSMAMAHVTNLSMTAPIVFDTLARLTDPNRPIPL